MRGRKSMFNEELYELIETKKRNIKVLTLKLESKQRKEFRYNCYEKKLSWFITFFIAIFSVISFVIAAWRVNDIPSVPIILIFFCTAGIILASMHLYRYKVLVELESIANTIYKLNEALKDEKQELCDLLKQEKFMNFLDGNAEEMGGYFNNDWTIH